MTLEFNAALIDLVTYRLNSDIQAGFFSLYIIGYIHQRDSVNTSSEFNFIEYSYIIFFFFRLSNSKLP